ncbi:MAG: hypothetical protein WC708_18720 [Lentisphaeria bacterium]
MNYSPKGMYIWDAWAMPTPDGRLHLYHLQRARTPEAAKDEDAFGHAVTADLMDWQERPACLGPAAGNPDDDIQPWTGCALWHQGRGYLYYTMRGSRNQAREQHIGLATATDPDVWTRHPGNPLITPDPALYATAERPTPGVVDCRDLIVVKDPAGPGWYGYFATRRPAKTLPGSSVIGCAYSDDLVRWRQLPPAFAPDKYACIEVPDVFQLDGRWYMTCLTGTVYGNRAIFSDPHVHFGTIYAVADRPEGPFHELADNVLVGAGSYAAPLSVRSFPWEGGRYILYTDRERAGRTDAGGPGFGTITTPKLLKAKGERLVAAYSPLVERKVTEERRIDWDAVKKRAGEAWGQTWPLQSGTLETGAVIRAANPDCWSIFPISGKIDSFILEAEVTLQGAAAGFCVRMFDHWNGDFLILDAERQELVYAAQPLFDYLERRRIPVEQGRRYNLKAVSRLEHLEVYVDDVLVMAFARYRGIGGEVGLFVDRGAAVFENVRLRELAVAAPA